MRGLTQAFELLGLLLGCAYCGLWFALSLMAIWEPNNRITIHFNNFNELWVDVLLFGLAFGLLGWLSIRRFKR